MAQSDEQQQPPWPYRPGVQLAIQAHTPPPPFSRDYGNEYYGNEYPIRSPVRDLPAGDQIDRLSFALSNPPLKTPQPAQAKSHVLTILEKIDRRKFLGFSRAFGGPHVVRCYLDSDESRHYAAKIYDGVDYPFIDDCDFDCMYVADRDYSCEAAAYQNIPLNLQGSIVPRYFGSWTFSVETGVSSCPHRYVRLILLEYVGGECVLDIILRAQGVTEPNEPPELFDKETVHFRLLPPEPERLEVLACVLEAEIALFHAGIRVRNLGPEKVLLISRSPMRVVLINFNRSLVYKCYERGREYLKSRDPDALPISPIHRYWGGSWCTDSFRKWVPQNWLTDEGGEKKWLFTRWGGSTKFEPPTEDFVARMRDPLLRTLTAQYKLH